MEEEKKNLGGRPRIHDREQIAIDLIEWAKKPDSMNFNKFCALYDPPFPATKLLDWSSEDPKGFRVAYNTAKAFIAFRREEKLATEELHVKAFDLNATVYDLLAKAEQRDKLAYESKLKKDEVKQHTQEQEERMNAMMHQIAELQQALKSSRIKNSADTRS